MRRLNKCRDVTDIQLDQPNIRLNSRLVMSHLNDSAVTFYLHLIRQFDSAHIKFQVGPFVALKDVRAKIF